MVDRATLALNKRRGIIAESGRPLVQCGRRSQGKNIHCNQGDALMFNRDGLFGKKDEAPRNDLRPVNVTPGLGGSSSGTPIRPQASVQPAPETPKPDLRFAEPPKAAPVRVEEPAGSRL